jgi:methylated-DNA-[protein]-cysteine S-methyltransferase
MKYAVTCDSSIGRIWLAEEGGALTDLRFKPIPEAEELETPLLKRAGAQLAEYFAGIRHRFDLPLDARGTAFQKSVWRALEDIPYGATRSYGDIASAVGKPSACRAVGQANNKTPSAVIIPCPRVVGADGGLAGYGGGLGIKQFLLELENRYK